MERPWSPWPLSFLRLWLSLHRWRLVVLLKGLTQLWKSHRIYPKYMPKCSVGSTDYVCNFLAKKKYWVMWKILRFEISAKEGLRDVILGSEEKNFRFSSALFTQFWRCKYGFVYYSNVQRTFKDGKIKSTVFTRSHAMKRHTIMSHMQGCGSHDIFCRLRLRLRRSILAPAPAPAPSKTFWWLRLRLRLRVKLSDGSGSGSGSGSGQNLPAPAAPAPILKSSYEP